jgi:formate hydrogenlyase subunit 3/multisubunit Na+/H+ antiporter MnhD subunit
MRATLFLLIFLPFLSALLLAVIGRRLPRRAVETIACLSILGSLTMAIITFASAGRRR